MKNIRLAAALVAILPLVAAAQTAETRAIDAYARVIDKHTANRQSPKIIVADVSDYSTGKPPSWRKFVSEKALERFRAETEAYTIAYNWLKKGRAVASNFTLFSPSGDWTKYVDYYFRANGALARIDVDYRTFHGDFIVLQKLYFDTAGKQIKKTESYRDLKTNKPKKPGSGYFGDNQPLLESTEVYKTPQKLPFASLLR